jgi:hypothetical protein
MIYCMYFERHGVQGVEWRFYGVRKLALRVNITKFIYEVLQELHLMNHPPAFLFLSKVIRALEGRVPFIYHCTDSALDKKRNRNRRTSANWIFLLHRMMEQMTLLIDFS